MRVLHVRVGSLREEEGGSGKGREWEGVGRVGRGREWEGGELSNEEWVS